MSAVICIGKPTIDKAASGEMVDVGQGVTIMAADGLLHASPYVMVDTLVAALKGVIAVSDRKTDEYDRARAAIAEAETL